MGYNHKAIDLLLRSIDARDRTAHRSVVDFLVADNKHLRAELAAAIKQRDEAQKEVCEMIARTRRKTGIRGQIVGLDRVTPAEIAVERGWDCFGEKQGGGA